MEKIRIDKLLVDLGFAESRTKAQALIMAGKVFVNERRVEKSSECFCQTANINVKDNSTKYVSRGGLKLEKALLEFGISPKEYICLDIGASTGGFTDCLLQHGAQKVIAIDVGKNQLAWKLRTDERVELREKVNARYLKPKDFNVRFDLIVMDVSFISVKKIIPALVPLLKPEGKLIVLIKPQFEVGKDEVGKGGIVRETEKHARVIKEVNEFATSHGLSVVGVIESPILGAEGNKEFLALYTKLPSICDVS
jgi:23S rRNA (cytidine1920-2'-O)/16S rRNA (cytidine1409-2'-O)-methyltransferase